MRPKASECKVYDGDGNLVRVEPAKDGVGSTQGRPFGKASKQYQRYRGKQKIRQAIARLQPGGVER